MPARRPPLAPPTALRTPPAASVAPATARPGARVRPPTAFPSGPAGVSAVAPPKSPALKAFDDGGAVSPGADSAPQRSFWDRVFGRNRQAATPSTGDEMGPPTPPPAGWQGLTDQSREKAFDPNADYNDPDNRHITDFHGRVIPDAYARQMAGGAGTAAAPAVPAKPVTQLSSARALNDRISKMIGLPNEAPPVTNADFGGGATRWPNVPLQAQPNPQVAAPMVDPMGRRPMMGPPAPSDRPSAQRQTSPTQTPPRVQAGSGSPFSGGPHNPFPALTPWMQRLLSTGQIYAGGGRVGLAMGGMPPGPPGDMMGGADDYRATVAGDDDDSGMMPHLASIGASHAVTGSSPLPQAPAPQMQQGDKGGGGGGMGDIASMAMKFLPMLLAHGGRTGFMRGGYPESFNQPPMAIPGLPQRTAFAGRGYVAGDGQGNGRSDHIDAALSPGEYVMDAETTSLLGDGDNEAGARKFEQMRQNIRKHKGKQLAAGKFSPAAKAPESYLSSKPTAADRLAHSGMSDGLRRGRR